ncbi:DUF6279 family lipoprotein [Vibrio palustris]|uniref:Lipoprotein n=1 Tax=Vibrio palustris TaxID=1918946 RepID=A0A1R4AZR7_9VIBR|nr:DUF6279 family lipoprotein [Vibrio palustris]SJL82166.1 hypothetical protein VPAL9027_00077 [Vibrio palustris]
MKKLKVCFLVFAACMVCSCSTTTFVYNNVDWLVGFYVDDYVELDSNQENILVNSVNKLQSWHRTTELRKYKSDLVLLVAQLKAENLNREQWLGVFSKVKQHIYNFRDGVSPEAIKLIKQLSDEQIDHMLALWAENDKQELDVFTKQDAAGKIKVRQEKITGAIEKNIGDLSSQQQEIVNRYSLRMKSTFIERNAYRKKLRAALKPLLVERYSSEFSDKFYFLLNNLDSFKSESLIIARQKNEYLYAELLAELNASLSKKQRSKLLQTLKSYITTIDSLMG